VKVEDEDTIYSLAYQEIVRIILRFDGFTYQTEPQITGWAVAPESSIPSRNSHTLSQNFDGIRIMTCLALTQNDWFQFFSQTARIDLLMVNRNILSWMRESGRELAGKIPGNSIILCAQPYRVSYHSGLPTATLPLSDPRQITEVAGMYSVTHTLLDDRETAVMNTYHSTYTPAWQQAGHIGEKTLYQPIS
jgi:hypothetical protein